ncbi:TlpA family protein disulfide reductase [Flavobacterium rhizosphaerae]|uniref:TlpA disulfide reductase family protein n=1 Tax=Flavobacterium rhizosphaerae TaxID=3163298 RepID=A0ABW8YRW5_9FLAO
MEDLTLTDMDGNTYTMESLKGKAIVIDFWFVTCAACIEEMPELNTMKEKYGTDEVAWFGITFDTKEQTERFLKRTQFDFTIIPNGKPITNRFGIKFYPTTLVLDENHEVVYTGDSGPILNAPKEIEKALKKVLKSIKKHKNKA